MNPTDYLQAMRAESIPAASSGKWYISKLILDIETFSMQHGKLVTVPAGHYTYLYRLTDSTMQNEPPGEVVMEDTPFELKTHLGFILSAYGKVLITGLGLGCVIRGLQANPNVENIVCIENSPNVLKMVAPYMPKEKLTIVEADALEWTGRNKDPFDCAWHDLWTDREAGEPHLDIWHAQLIRNCMKKVDRQGAWNMSRLGKKVLMDRGFPWMG